MRVDVTVRASAMLGAIERQNSTDPDRLSDIRGAWLRLLVELRRGHPAIWDVPSELRAEAWELYEPPLIAHFIKIDDSRLCVIDVQEILPQHGSP